MVLTRKQAADSSQATSATTRGHDASSFTDVSPDSNLNLLASSASSHVLNPAPGSSNPPPPRKEEAQRSTPTVTTTSSSGGGEQDGSSRPPADSSSLPTSVVTSSSLTELPGSTVNITVGSTENAVHSTTILVMPPDALSALSRTAAAASSSSEQGGVAVAAASASSSRRKRRTSSSEKEAQRQYKVMYKYLKLASSAPKLMGVSSVVPPAATSTSTAPTPAQSSLQSPGNASLPGDAGAMISTMTTTPKLTPLSGNVGTRITTTTTTTGKTMTPQPVVVPVSHTPSTRLPSVSLLGSGIAGKPPVRPSPAPHQGAVKTLPPPTVIFVSPQTPTSMASATVVSLPVGASGVRTKPPPHLLPAVGTSGTKAAVIRSSSSTTLPVLTPGSWGVNSQATPSAQSVVTTAPCSSQSTFTPSPQPAVNRAASTVVPSSGQSTSASDPQTGPCVSSVAAVTGQAVSTSLSGRSVSQSLVSTAKAGQTGHHSPANIPATATKDDEKGHSLSSTDGNSSSTAKGDATTTLALTQATATSQGVHVNSQIPPATTTTTTTTTTSTTIRNGIPRITDVPSPNPPQSSGLSAPLPPRMTSLPKHTQTPTVLSVPSLESSTQPPASLAAPTDGPTHPSTPPAAPEGGGGGGGSQLGEGESVTWDKACTLRLIQLYKEHQVYLTDPHYKKKSVWELMASKLRQSMTDSPPFRWNHVENKWKNMTKKFRDCVNVNRRVGSSSSSSSVTKCNFFDEIAAIYNYNPEEDKKKAAESPWTVKVVTNRHVPLPLSKNVGDGLTPGGDLRSSGNVNARVENGSTQTDGCGSSSVAGPSAQIIDDVPLVKKKKYAHLDAQQASCSRPLASCTTRHPPPPPPPAEARERGGGADIAGLLQRLREDRARQESARMDRLESMHQEKMALFGRFLDILQQSKQKKG